ncbi:MAG: hypothetical protein J7545_01780 [Roseofilum sp. SBFL]|uniref:hypothetical protein n=1 Tax=unclassified Roseofilum TaxID=2620099 RepID=UPI001B1BB335|nr:MULTISPECIES: hypothetical protein [unclassified Roseofilum]MBP0014167.1 hypothetical protein [Roseofilum sp. SID3]MBP0024064.1 hypothetical protein [Roseofilum sp. SID2]MBP0036110.1 hypothetical protein [Roseofilum sp. SID1]MBP0040695.1 hypothetical protein [Roseofilum sp. SBFL]
MNQQPTNPHNQAQQQFQHSLHQLEETLKTGKVHHSSAQKSDPLSSRQFQEPEAIDEATLEEAAADIEELINQLSSEDRS